MFLACRQQEHEQKGGNGKRDDKYYLDGVRQLSLAVVGGRNFGVVIFRRVGRDRGNVVFGRICDVHGFPGYVTAHKVVRSAYPYIKNVILFGNAVQKNRVGSRHHSDDACHIRIRIQPHGRYGFFKRCAARCRIFADGFVIHDTCRAVTYVTGQIEKGYAVELVALLLHGYEIRFGQHEGDGIGRPVEVIERNAFRHQTPSRLRQGKQYGIQYDREFHLTDYTIRRRAHNDGKEGLKMDIDEKQLLTRLMRIERRLDSARENNKLAHYNEPPYVHKKQMAFHKCRKRNRWVFGGNRSGKTECGAAEVVWRARGIHPYASNKRTEGWVVSLTREVQRDVAQRKILSYLKKEWIADAVMISGKSSAPECGVIDYLLIKNVFGTLSRIGFKSCESGREKFQGTGLDYVWFDEEPPEDIYDECRMRLMDRRGEMFGTMTPLKGLTFVYNRIYMSDDPDVWCEFMEWADNPYLDPDEIAGLSANLPEDVLESRRYGRFIRRSGLVYPEFDESIHVIDPFPVPADWQDIMSIDPGLHNPLACHWYAVDGDGRVYVVAEHFAAGKDVDWHAERIREKCASLGWRCDNSGRYRALIDPAANQRTLGGMRSVSALFGDRGILVSTNVNKDVYSGINTVKSFLKGEGEPRLYIFRSCVNMIRELKTYAWGDDDAPVKKDDHCVDELRYYLMTAPKGKSVPEVRSAVRKDKDRLAAALSRRRYGR